MNRTIEIRSSAYTITVHLFGEDTNLSRVSGTITSDLHNKMEESYDSAIDGLEVLILAHACAGINIQDAKYLEGIDTALEDTNNKF